MLVLLYMRITVINLQHAQCAMAQLDVSSRPRRQSSVFDRGQIKCTKLEQAWLPNTGTPGKGYVLWLLNIIANVVTRCMCMQAVSP